MTNPQIHAAEIIRFPSGSDCLRLKPTFHHKSLVLACTEAMGVVDCSPMHLRLSDQEFATLVEMISLAALVASWNSRETADAAIATYESLEHKILERAGHAGLGGWVEFDDETQRLRLRREVEERLFAHECYDEFRNENFWDELVLRLADRDLARAIGPQKCEMLSEDDRRRRAKAWEDRYWDEFAKNGVGRVVVLTPPEEG